MTIHAPPAAVQADAIQQVKIRLAAALRLAGLDGFEEGIDNHFTACVPGRQGWLFGAVNDSGFANPRPRCSR